MYADDTRLFCCLENITSNNKEVVLNNELQHVHSWLSANRLTLNVKNTKYMLFRKHKNNDIGDLNLRICNDAIQYVNEFNFLGLYINSKLNWDTRTNVIDKRISRAVDIIKKHSLAIIGNASLMLLINLLINEKMQLVFPKSILITIYNA